MICWIRAAKAGRSLVGSATQGDQGDLWTGDFSCRDPWFWAQIRHHHVEHVEKQRIDDVDLMAIQLLMMIDDD